MSETLSELPAVAGSRGTMGEVALLALKLGFTAFGGPAAHIAMLHDEVVTRRKWVTIIGNQRQRGTGSAMKTLSRLAKSSAASTAFTFVLILGVVNLFADMTYEGASSINGQFLGTLGASAAAIGAIAGVGEFLGYALRSVSGYISDKTGKYWLATFVGYSMNLLAVPALALAGNWPIAAGLVIAERVGRAIRKPTVEAMLSYTTGSIGKGWVFAVNNALDQIGGVLGTLLIALVLLWRGDYRTGYTVLLLSALLALVTLAIARLFFPNPSRLEAGIQTATLKGFTTSYWLYMLAGGCVAAGLVSFELISFHFSSERVVTGEWIPLFFALAMGIDAVSGLVFGRVFDRVGIPIVLSAFFLSALFAPFVFLGNFTVAILGMILWGIGFGAQDTLLKSLIASVLPEGKRNLAFGLFYTGYGSGWLIGSITTGILYGQSRLLLVAFSVIVQLFSLRLFFIASRTNRGGGLSAKRPIHL
jgi:MFS family permease